MKVSARSDRRCVQKSKSIGSRAIFNVFAQMFFVALILSTLKSTTAMKSAVHTPIFTRRVKILIVNSVKINLLTFNESTPPPVQRHRVPRAGRFEKIVKKPNERTKNYCYLP